MNCPNCNKGILTDDNYCSNCGCNLKQNKSKNLIFYTISVIIILIFSLYFYLHKISSTINLDDSNVPVIEIQADKCSSFFVKNEVLSIFKNSDIYYNNIAYSSIAGLKIINDKTIVAENNNSKYICSGIIELTSYSKGFKPKNYDENNLFYNKVFIENDDLKIKKYTSFQLPIIYTSYIMDNKNYVKINEEGKRKFDCIGNCEPIYKNEQQTVSIKNKIEKSVKKSNSNNIEIQSKEDKENLSQPKKTNKLKELFKKIKKKRRKSDNKIN